MIAKDLQSVSLADQMTQDYYNYSMAVNLGRALPDVRDGLKPVQRRVLFTMSQLGLTHDAPFKKSARITGDVMGKYHPHSSSYLAMVNLATDFHNRYPLVDGQGNYGSTSDGPASERYTEARLQKFSEDVLLGDLGKQWCKFKPNYDGSLQEPVTLPARLPLLLLMGTSGIGVAAACTHVPYNLGQVVKLAKAALRGNLRPEDALKYVTQPDFAMGGHVALDDGLRAAIVTGEGTIRLYGKVHLDETRRQIVCTELPQDVSPERVLTQTFTMVSEEVLDRKLLGDVRDESDRAGTRVVWQLTEKAWTKGLAPWVLSKLLKHTSLQTTISVNAISVDPDGSGYSLRGVSEVANAWATHRVATETDRMSYLIESHRKRIAICEGVLVALANIVRVAECLIAGHSLQTLEIGLVDEQVEAIEAMPLSALRAKNRVRLASELEELRRKVDLYEALLSDRSKLVDYLCDDLGALSKEYGDSIRTGIYQAPEYMADVGTIDTELKAGAELVSKTGYLITTGTDTYLKSSKPSRKCPSTTITPNSQVGIAVACTDGKIYWLPSTEMVADTTVPLRCLLGAYGRPIDPLTKVLWSRVVDLGDHSALGNTHLVLRKHDASGRLSAKKINLVGLLEMTARKKSITVGDNLVSCWVAVKEECTKMPLSTYSNKYRLV